MKDTNPKDAVANNKIPLSLLSPIAKAAWAVAQLAGGCKYGFWNFRISGVRASVYLDAIDRHRDGILSGEWYDPVDGTPHLGNIMACCAILLDAHAAGKLVDDRPPSVSMRPTYEELEKLIGELKSKYKDVPPRHYTIEDTDKTAALVSPAAWRPVFGRQARIKPNAGIIHAGKEGMLWPCLHNTFDFCMSVESVPGGSIEHVNVNASELEPPQGWAP